MKKSSVLKGLCCLALLQGMQALPAIAQANDAMAEMPTKNEAAVVEPEQTTYSVFMLVKTTNQWLQLSPEARFAFLDTDINPILEKNPAVEMRFFDTEGFNSRVTDVIVWESSSLEAYQGVIEALRESDFWGTYFEVVEILPGIENAYASYYDVSPY